LRAHGLSHKESQETMDNPKECNVVSGMGSDACFSLNDGGVLHGARGTQKSVKPTAFRLSND
jgi:hypothetical protein